MQKNFAETLLDLLTTVDHLKTSETLNSQQQDSLESIKFLGENLGKYFDNAEKEISSLKQRLKQLYQSNPYTDAENGREIDTLLALMFARLRQSITVDELLETVVFEVHQLLQSDHVIAYQLSEQFLESNSLFVEYEVVNDQNRSLLGRSLPTVYTDPDWLENYQSCLSQVINDINLPNIDPKVKESLIPLGVKSAIAIAIPRGKKSWGLLIIHKYEIARDWQTWEIELLEKLGTQLAIAIHQLQLLVKSESLRFEKDQIIARLHHSQLHDSLTGLPNYDSFMDSLNLAFAKLQITSNHNFAILFIDCDRFQSINHNFGIPIGDQLLKGISQRLNVYHKINVSIARINSDEFAILVENIDSQESIIELAETVTESIKQPFIIENNQIFTSVSIGIAISDLEYICANEVFRDANIAMHYSRRFGRGKYALFSTSMSQGAKVRWQLENDLRHALERQEFHLVYQPIVSLHQHQLTGFEVLLRWLHPLQGLISTQEFLVIAEETGDIVEIGYWVLKTACNQLQQWQKTFSHIPTLTLGINVSTLQVVQSDFVERIQEIINERQISPNLIKLEITESILMGNFEISSQKLEQLQEVGVQIYIDDFGTGFSSFSYLKNLPIDVLKIDRSFISKVSTDIKSQRIIQSILRLANSLGMGIVIEGVETSEELDYFESSGGSSIEVQGYFISHPLDAEMATQWIQTTI
ncbi:MAG TPA: hypothetical protein DCZ88_06435 [Pseudanabaena sp.]|nr:hypothetical protein [Pseudanabaena sp.]